MNIKINDKIISSDDIKQLIQTNMAGDRHNTQNFINMQVKLANAKGIEDTCR